MQSQLEVDALENVLKRDDDVTEEQRETIMEVVTQLVEGEHLNTLVDLKECFALLVESTERYVECQAEIDDRTVCDKYRDEKLAEFEALQESCLAESEAAISSAHSQLQRHLATGKRDIVRED